MLQLTVLGSHEFSESSLCKESPAELMPLTFAGRDCLWDSEEQDREWTAQLICSLSLYATRLPLGQRGAKRWIDIPFHSLCCSSLSQRQSCPIQKRGADQLYSPFYVLLLAVPDAVSSHTKVRRISSAGLSLRRKLSLNSWLPRTVNWSMQISILCVRLFVYLQESNTNYFTSKA